MNYQALARKWRPQDFAGVVGQDPVVTALRNAVADGRIAQAYLFSGIRGVGKTSVARILTKSLNCLNGPDGGPNPEPCNECSTCEEITRGADMDVLEVDAATYSKVEQVRELTESLKYGPARDRYKVVVLDEIHRLSRQAFDALLKIVEEPPERLVFVFATTEVDAVPATILSRCQEFRFRRVATPDLAAHLRQIADAEEIEVSDAALNQLARAGEGSVRDAVALLDQLATYGQGSIQDQDAERVLGEVDLGFFARLLEAITGGDTQEITTLASEVDAAGWDPRHVHARFLEFCRAGLRIAAGTEADSLDLPQSARESLSQIAPRVGFSNLLRLTQLLLTSEATVRRSENASLAIEIAWLRAAELPRLVAIEEALEDIDSFDPESDRSAKASPQATPAAPRSAQSTASSSPPQESTPHPQDETVDSQVRRLLDVVNRRRVSLAAHLEEAEELKLEDSELRIVTAKEDDWLQRALERRRNREALEAALEEVCGESVPWQIEAKEAGGAVPADEPEVSAASADEIAQHPAVQRTLEIFDGRIEGVERGDNS